MKIIIDTREQHPWAFPEELATVERGTLKTGDYALKFDNEFAIERKSLSDYIGTVAAEWGRFVRELDRMSNFPAKIIIVEGSFADIINNNYDRPQITPAFIIKRTAELAMRGACVLFCDNAVSAAGMAYYIFKERLKDL